MAPRRAARDDLKAVLRLYGFLNPSDPLLDPQATHVIEHWNRILSDPRLRYFVAEAEGQTVATCTLTLIPNLTRNMRPYGVIENVVTDPAFCQRGFGTGMLHYALAHAWREHCYKVMLLTGSKRESTLRF